MVVKSEDAFKTISEVSNELNIPQHVLRFWEKKFSYIRPMTRGGGRRFYRPNDIKLLKAIHKLLYKEMYTINGVQNIFRQKGKAYILSLNDSETIEIIEVGKPIINMNEGEYKTDLFEENAIPQVLNIDFKKFLSDSLVDLKEMDAILEKSYN
ncbi:MAG: MerR family transcriptional regulator [Hyphomicrobiales bacterium]|jgi:DNA-binding transcriptional MerR regulator|nr:MerR family transcriptional regulator [Hyphomicrobiales bacterium]|tara:strand:- start:205 stop:663 length:459 start_codon:yes stop_codon:yes gene_type:complete